MPPGGMPEAIITMPPDMGLCPFVFVTSIMICAFTKHIVAAWAAPPELQACRHRVWHSGLHAVVPPEVSTHQSGCRANVSK